MYPNTTYYPQNSYQAPQRQPSAPQIQSTQSPLVSPFLKGRLVSSIEEARAQTIDFDGSVFYFPDLANHRIYTKQINLDGTSTLNMYELTEIPQEIKPIEDNRYITREEFEKVISQIQENFKGAVPAKEILNTQPVPAPQPAARESFNF